jgi:hypothetical protein
MSQPTQLTDTLESVVRVFQLIAWPSVVLLAWKVARWLAKMEGRFNVTLDYLRTTLTTLQATLTTLTTNHLPHLQAAVEKTAQEENEGQDRIVNELRELRADIRASKQ